MSGNTALSDVICGGIPVLSHRLSLSQLSLHDSSASVRALQRHHSTDRASYDDTAAGGADQTTARPDHSHENGEEETPSAEKVCEFGDLKFHVCVREVCSIWSVL